MDGNVLVVLIALAVALATWGVAQLVFSSGRDERKKLQQRMTSEWRSDPGSLRSAVVSIEKPIENLPAFLANSRILRKINRDLRQAYPDAKLINLLGIAVAVGLLLATVVSFVVNFFPAGLVAGLAGLWLPRLVLNSKRARRQEMLVNQLPDALDFLSRILRAGHSLSTGIQMMGDELPAPIGGEFRRCYDQHGVGQSLEEAMRDMAAGVQSSDFAFFVTAVLIQRQTGGDLTEVLKNISTMLRGRLSLQQHVRAITAEGRLTGYILVAFPVVLFALSYALNPGYAGVLINTSIGKTMLGVAVVLQAVGLVVIRKIVNVKA